MNNQSTTYAVCAENCETERHRDIFDYIREQNATFREAPLCVEDCLLLTQLAYLHLGGFVRGLRRYTLSVPIRKLAQPEILDEICRGVRETENTRRLVTMAAASRRFGHIRVKFFEDITDHESHKQFCAVTFLLDSKTAFIAYRGTDNTIVGWRENFNMAFMSPIPAQTESAEYLREVGSYISRRNLFVGGHSKGGNLAMYAAMNCGRVIQQRIIGIYNLDGPGFKDDVIRRAEMQAIKDRLHNILPESAMIGTLLKTCGERKVVHSAGTGFDQHNPNNWKFDGLSLSYAPSLSRDAMVFDEIVDNWLDTLTAKQRELLVNALFKVINETGAVSFNQVIEMIQNGEISAFRVVKDMDADTRKQLLPMLKGLGVEYLKSKFSSKK